MSSEPDAPATPTASRRALAQPGFTPFWAGQALSQLGFQFEGLAMAVLAVQLLHATEAQMGFLNAANTAAFLLVGLIAGAWVDRWRKRRVMIVADLVRAALVLAIPALWFAGVLTFWHLVVVAAVVGIATVFFDVAYQSYVPILVHAEAVSDANGKLESTAQVARLGGPALAGVLLRVVSAPVLLVANAVGFLASAATLAVVRDDEVPPPAADRRPLATEIREGLAFVFAQPLLRHLLAATGLSNFGSTIVFTLQAILVLRILGLDAALFGLVMSLGAVGGLVGSVAAARLGERFGEGPTLRAVLAASGLGSLLVPASAFAPAAALPMLVASTLVFSFCVVVYNVIQVSARQRLCPPRLLGRMNASIRFVVWGIMPLAALLAGALGSVLGTVGALWVGAALNALSVLPFLGRFGRMRTLPRTAVGA